MFVECFARVEYVEPGGQLIRNTNDARATSVAWVEGMGASGAASALVVVVNVP